MNHEVVFRRNSSSSFHKSLNNLVHKSFSDVFFKCRRRLACLWDDKMSRSSFRIWTPWILPPHPHIWKKKKFIFMICYCPLGSLISVYQRWIFPASCDRWASWPEAVELDIPTTSLMWLSDQTTTFLLQCHIRGSVPPLAWRTKWSFPFTVSWPPWWFST